MSLLIYRDISGVGLEYLVDSSDELFWRRCKRVLKDFSPDEHSILVIIKRNVTTKVIPEVVEHSPYRASNLPKRSGIQGTLESEIGEQVCLNQLSGLSYNLPYYIQLC